MRIDHVLTDRGFLPGGRGESTFTRCEIAKFSFGSDHRAIIADLTKSKTASDDTPQAHVAPNDTCRERTNEASQNPTDDENQTHAVPGSVLDSGSQVHTVSGVRGSSGKLPMAESTCDLSGSTAGNSAELYTNLSDVMSVTLRSQRKLPKTSLTTGIKHTQCLEAGFFPKLSSPRHIRKISGARRDIFRLTQLLLEFRRISFNLGLAAY